MATTTWDQKSGMTSATDVDNLESYAEQADASATAAAASATAAAASATAAAASETASDASETASAASAAAAATSATSASTSAATATTKAAEASTSATNAATSATSAQTAQTAAETAQTAAEAAQTGAETAETNAASSATAAASSASSASTSATSATASETAAAASATAASASETAAAASETAAGTSETNAAASASTASTAATTATTKAAEASTSATNAATSASNAATSATNAATSETNAAASETAAANSATSAAGSASAASTSATAASASQTAAAASEAAAAASETAAATSATNAATSATTASNAATTATTKASEASTSAFNAATSETNASTSATAAASSASSAQSSADAALAALDSFDDRYLGQKASDPTVDNDGNALVAGALYFNTTDDVMKVYDGSIWVAAYASLSGALLAANDLSDLNNTATARTNLGLGTAATTASTDYATAAQGALADTALQSSDIGVSVQGYSAVLAGTTASYTTAEEAKLAGIEAGATADQTAAEIKTAYESNANTNAYTDAEKSKLAGIEAGATADQTITAGSGLTGGGTGNVTVSHADTSTQSSVNNSGATVIQDVTLDTYGHVTGLASKTLTAADVGAAASSHTHNYAGAASSGGAAYDANAIVYTGYGSGEFTANQTAENWQTWTGGWATHLISSHGDGSTYYNQTIIMPFWGAPQYMRKEGGTNVGPYKFWTEENDGASSGLDADLLDGQHGSYYYPASNPNGYTTNTGTVTSVATGGGLTGGTITGSGTISHADTSAQGSVNNSGATVIQDVTLDTYGHVTGLASATLTASTVGALASTNPVISSGTITEDVYAISGTSVSLEPDNGSVQLHTLTGRTTYTDGFTAGQAITLMIDDGTAHTITWPTMTWVNNGGSAPTLATSGYTVLALWKVSTTLYGALVGDGS